MDLIITPQTIHNYQGEKWMAMVVRSGSPTLTQQSNIYNVKKQEVPTVCM